MCQVVKSGARLTAVPPARVSLPAVPVGNALSDGEIQAYDSHEVRFDKVLRDWNKVRITRRKRFECMEPMLRQHRLTAQEG